MWTTSTARAPLYLGCAGTPHMPPAVHVYQVRYATSSASSCPPSRYASAGVRPASAGWRPAEARDYRTAARILELLAVRSVALLTNNPDKIDGLRAEGIGSPPGGQARQDGPPAVAGRPGARRRFSADSSARPPGSAPAPGSAGPLPWPGRPTGAAAPRPAHAGCARIPPARRPTSARPGAGSCV